MIKTISIAASLIAIAAAPSLARSVHDDSRLQTVISVLRGCVRSNSQAAQTAGVRSSNEAAEFFSQRCYATIANALAEAKNVVVPPGRFRYVIQEEWATFTADPNK
jgi:hypothetical protein